MIPFLPCTALQANGQPGLCVYVCVSGCLCTELLHRVACWNEGETLSCKWEVTSCVIGSVCPPTAMCPLRVLKKERSTSFFLLLHMKCLHSIFVTENKFKKQKTFFFLKACLYLFSLSQGLYIKNSYWKQRQLLCRIALYRELHI